ncbi:MAG TPA: carboxypeptidase-like regulatory domain-containing protein [Bryobacteraceae bacterium]
MRLQILVLVLASVAFAQSDRATITGTVSDPAGAVVPNAPVEARNPQTGATYQGATSATGNFTLSQLPAGAYELTVTVPGFKKYVRQNIVVQVAQVLRLDVPLQVGSATEAVTVTAEVSLLRTESGELSHNVSTATLDNLPILGIGQNFAGSSGIRNPQAAAFLLPGSYVQPNSNVRINGAPGNTASYRIEGQWPGSRHPGAGAAQHRCDPGSHHPDQQFRRRVRAGRRRIFQLHHEVRHQPAAWNGV